MIEETEQELLWRGMPEFVQKKVQPFKKCLIHIKEDSTTIIIRFDCEKDFKEGNPLSSYYGDKDFHLESTLSSCYDGKDFHVESREILSELLKQKITNRTKSIWHPFKPHWGGVRHKYVGKPNIQPRYPVYIVSKGRSHNGLTTKALNEMGVSHFIVVEESERDLYEKTCDAEILVLPQEYLDDYDTCDELGDSRSRGPGAARNFCIDHSKRMGHHKHWVMDDNLDAFHYLNRNKKYEVETGATLAAAEDFTDRYSNIPVSGLNYYSFCKSTDPVPPFVKNTRIYSCLLIDSTFGYRWRGRYNEDTDLSLRVLKDGLCTIQFNAFLCGKVTTQRMRGGNSKEFYDKEGTLPKSQMIKDLHPDVADVVWRFNRWHHHVNYKPFKNNTLIEKAQKHREKIDNYGMVLVDL